jgi:response regulator RpfG family c-di-GMP phosphodiesterase
MVTYERNIMDNKPALLLVDDEERILRSLRMLFFTGYDVRMTTDANEAIRILKSERIHVIVSDQRMPIMLGAELLRTAREISPYTMRILLTGYSDFEASVASINEGEVFRYLLKPWEGEEVRRVVAEAASIAEASFAAQLAASQAAVSEPAKKPRVLIMDHDESTVLAVREILQERCEIIWAADVQHAMEELAKEDVAVVVADLTLGENNVAYVLKTMKQFNPQTQSIVVTALNDTGRLIELINQAQISRYLPKPLLKSLLARNLEYVLDRFHALCSLPAMQKRQSVVPIVDPQERQMSSIFMGMLNSLRAKAGRSAL